MSLVNLIFKSSWTNKGQIGVRLEGLVTFNANLTLNESHQRTSTITDHAIESGAKVSDHIIRDPERITVLGFVTDTPGKFGQWFPGATQGAFDTLDKAWSAGELFTVYTGRKKYENMVIESLELPRDRDGSMQFSITMRHVRIVETASVKLPKVKVKAADSTPSAKAAAAKKAKNLKDKATKVADKGRQAAKVAGTASKAAKQTSVALKGLKSIGVLK